MYRIKDFIRPIYRAIVKPHIKRLCRGTQEDFKLYKDKYIGKRCFIVANGPSLSMEDLDVLAENGEITFGMNRIYMIYDRTIWRPNFFVTQDPTIIRTCYDEIIKNTTDSTLFVKVPGEPKYDIPNAIYYDLDYSNVIKNIPPNFYDGSNCIFADGKTVTYSALQIAVYMGFSEIYLIGTDCNYSTDNNVCEDSYPDDRMYDADKIGKMPPDITYSFAAYEVAKKYAEQKNIMIYNATRGGMLEVFKRVKFDDLFN